MIRAMSARAHRRGSGARVGRGVAAAVLCMAGLVLAAAFLGITVQANALEREKAALRADIAAAQAEQAARTAHIAEQKTQDYVRDKARDFGFIGANESLIAVERSGQTSGSEVPAVSEAWSRIGRWIAFFFGPR